MAKQHEVKVDIPSRSRVQLRAKPEKKAKAASAAGFTAFLLVPNRSAGIPESLHLKSGSRSGSGSATGIAKLSKTKRQVSYCTIARNRSANIQSTARPSRLSLDRPGKGDRSRANRPKVARAFTDPRRRRPYAVPGPSDPDLFSASSRIGARGRRQRQRPGLLPALTLFGLAAVPGPPRHFELEPGLSGLDGVGAVLDPRAAFLGSALHHARPSIEVQGRVGDIDGELVRHLRQHAQA